MPSRRFKITSNSITWDKSECSVTQNDTGMIEVRAVGYCSSAIGLEAALLLIPATCPADMNGPVGNANILANARLATRTADWGADGTIRVEATYRTSGAGTTQFPGGQDQSDYDRAERRIAVVEEPILTHPCAMELPQKEKTKLAHLMGGTIIPGRPRIEDGEPVDPENEFEWDFIDADGQRVTGKVEFSSDNVTVDGISLSALDFARMIAAGIQTYQRKTVRHTWRTSRNNPASNSDYRAVGTVINNPPKAPSLSSGYQWMLTGITDVSNNDSSWSTDYEFEASGPGGYLKIYRGGSASP